MTDSNKTRVVQIGRSYKDETPKVVNPVIMRGSTVLYGTVEKMNFICDRGEAGENVLRYGSFGTQNAFTLQDVMSEIEGGESTMLFPTGLAAIAHVLISTLKVGDHVLMSEDVYHPARILATKFLAQRGIECEFYACSHKDIAKRLKPNTQMVYLDNPGSITYRIQDLPAIASLLRKRKTLLAVDNTWGAAGLYCPLKLGADISIVAITKYIAGHSDLMMGSVTVNTKARYNLERDARILGQIASPDDCYMALRGLRTVEARLTMHRQHAHQVITAIQDEPDIDQILYPGLTTDTGYVLFKRDFNGSNGLITLVFKPELTEIHIKKFANALRIFGLGASWGGYESLIMIYDKVGGWNGGHVARLHIGLEAPEDLIADIKQALKSMKS
ncbi:MAG: PLP-dependent transferase [Hyphomicrobiaceae bacterium]|nr:PLP-dependent transferase [Hyphomicrobiaceae bacterium]